MLELKAHFKNNSLHHAYLIESTKDVLPELLSLIEGIGLAKLGNPDVVVGKYSTFTIDDARKLKGSQIEHGGDKSGKKFFIIQTDFFNIEAQQALLKVFEEPAPNVHFFIITSRAGTLIDTLASRVVYIKSTSGSSLDMDAGKKFLKQSKPERLEFISKLIKSHDDDEDSGLLRGEAIKLLNNIESALHSDLDFKKLSQNNAIIFEEINNARKYLATPGASVKMILEGIALLC